MSQEGNNRICPVERAGGLDNRFRRIIQNPGKILKPFVKKGMTVLDIGCGPGFFTIEIASMLEGSGKVIAADIQKGMLDKLAEKIKGTILEDKIQLYEIQDNGIGLNEQVDLVLAFYMVHEVPDKKTFFEELRTIIRPGGKLLIVEPVFHVNKKAFKEMDDLLQNSGFKTGSTKPRIFFSRSLVAEI
jgi:ubiquinone/menaquinone biosynthesis C-methylase UbiE